jgi:hypothetical protein
MLRMVPSARYARGRINEIVLAARTRPSFAHNHNAISKKTRSRRQRRERSAERRMLTIAAQTGRPRGLSVRARQRALSGRARLPALCCGIRQGERIRHWLSSSSRVS